MHKNPVSPKTASSPLRQCVRRTGKRAGVDSHMNVEGMNAFNSQDEDDGTPAKSTARSSSDGNGMALRQEEAAGEKAEIPRQGEYGDGNEIEEGRMSCDVSAPMRVLKQEGE